MTTRSLAHRRVLRRGAPSTARAGRRLAVLTTAVATVLMRLYGTPERAPRAPKALDVLVATVLSQNTSDTNSHRAYSRLRARYRNWEDVATAPLRGLEAALRPGGMASQKARRIKELLAKIHTRAGKYSLDYLEKMPTGEVMTHLQEFKGVGLKTAACVSLFSLGRDIFPVDTHVHRICGRLGLSPGCRTPEDTFRAMAPLVPRGKAHAFHINLIRFGRHICRARDPICGVCPLYARCLYPGRTDRKPTEAQAGSDPVSFMLLDNVRV